MGSVLWQSSVKSSQSTILSHWYMVNCLMLLIVHVPIILQPDGCT
jgi:hypothetical protein